MRRRDAFLLGLYLLASLAVVGYGTRVARRLEHGGAWRAELSPGRGGTLSDATRSRLAGLEEKVLVTYAVSPPERMPSDRKDLERRVVDLLEAMRRAAPEHFDYLMIDPDSDPDLVDFASRRRFSPQRVRTVRGDAWSEREVWSSLSIAYGGRPEAVLHGIGPEHLPRLQETLLAQLEQLEAPRRPRIALAAPPGFDGLAERLAERGELTRLDLDAQATAWPEDADLLLWVQPGEVSTARLGELERFLAAGRSVVLAGSLLLTPADALVVAEGGAPALRLAEAGGGWGDLLARLGVEPVRGLVCDERSDALDLGGELLPAPFLVRCIAPNQDFETWRRLPNGTLAFTAPTPFAVDEDALRGRGRTARVLATSSDRTWVQPAPVPPAPPLPLADMRPDAGLPTAKQPLVLELVPDDPWRGHVLLLASTSPLEDAMLAREGFAHANLVRALLDEYTADERLVVATAARDRVAPLPDLGAPGRLAARAVVVGLPPLVLAAAPLLVAALRRLRGGRVDPGAAPARRSVARRAAAPMLPIGFAAGLVLLLLVAGRLGGCARAQVDLTAEGLHGLAPESRAIAHRAGERGPTSVQLLVSPEDALPPELRPRLRRLRGTLAALDRAGADLRVTRVAPESLPAAEYVALTADGLARARTTDRLDEVTLVRDFHAAVRLQRGDRVELLPFDTQLAFEELEFRLAFALWRLETGRHPRVGFASDVPRPSAAEAYENFQSQGLFAPTGVDVYAAARARLAGLDLELLHVNPRAPELPPDLDALLWLQPRRSIAPMLEAAARHLVGGGDLFIASQHFKVQARQYRGAGFEGVLWPQPQSPDLEHLWLPELGIQLVREVLFDARHTTLPVEAQVVGRGAGRVFERQEMALPFLIRADATHFDPTHPITRQLGDQALSFAGELGWDEARLAELGLSARTLITTSPDTWSYAWKGGWLPTELLEGPAPDLEGGSSRLGTVPLMAEFTGAFPVPTGHLTLSPPADQESGEPLPPPPRADWPRPAPGRLVLLTCSEVFTDGRLLDPDFRGDHLLVHTALHLALPPELAAIALRRDVPRGFGAVDAEARARWRAVVLGSGPLLLASITLGWLLLRRRVEALP